MSEQTQAPEQNGAAATPEVTLPVTALDEALPFLRRPFTTAAVKFRVLASFPKNDPNAGLVVAYIDARLAVERLNMVVGERWTARYVVADGGGKLMWCHLAVCGVERADVGEGIGKGLVSDALKRAGVPFGIGVSLYALPKIFLKAADGHVKQATVDGKKTVTLTPAGEERCRVIYDMWLDAKGRQAFGDPLDHGDALDAAGDAEAEGPPKGVDSGTGESAPTLDPARAKGILGGIKALKLQYGAINVMLGAAGADGLHANTPEGVEARISSLSKKQAEAVEAELEKRAVAVQQDSAAEEPDAPAPAAEPAADQTAEVIGADRVSRIVGSISALGLPIGQVPAFFTEAGIDAPKQVGAAGMLARVKQLSGPEADKLEGALSNAADGGNGGGGDA